MMGKKNGGTEMPRKFMDKRFEASLKKLQNILKKEREHQGISRTEVAKRMGISRPYLSQLESENCHLYWRMFLSWCQALKISPQSIIERWQRLLRIFSNPWTNSFNSFVFYFCLCCYPVSMLRPPSVHSEDSSPRDLENSSESDLASTGLCLKSSPKNPAESIED